MKNNRRYATAHTHNSITAIIPCEVYGVILMKIISYYVNAVKLWLLTVREEQKTPQSRLHWLLEKIPLLMVMYGSSVLVGISTYNTFPSLDPFLRYSSAVLGGMAFDVILTATVFSLRKNMLSILTIIAALFIGFAIALDLYMSLNMPYLHATYIFMAVMYGLHVATTRGLDIKTIEKRLTDAEHTTSILQHTNTILTTDNDRLSHTIADYEHTISDLRNTVDNHRDLMIERLATKTSLTANEIVSAVGGDRNAVMKKVAAYRNVAE